MFSRKIIISIIVVVSISLIAAMILNKEDVTKKMRQSKAKYVTTAMAKKGNYQPMHSVIGKILSESVENITSEVNAKVSEVKVRSGDFVAQGQLLVVLDNKNALRELERLDAQLLDLTAQIEMQKGQHKLDQSFLEFDENQLEKAQESYDREKKLLNKQLISNSRFEQVESQLNQAQRAFLQRELSIKNQDAQSLQLQSNLKQLQINIQVAKENLKAHEITAAIAGQIGNLNLKKGQPVSIGQNLLTLFNDQSRLFEVKVASVLAKETSATLEVNNQEYSVLSVDPLLEQNSAGQKVVFDISGQTFPIDSYQYAYWISPAIENSFLIEPKALFEYERVYYLKEKEKEKEKEDKKDQDQSSIDEVSQPVFVLQEAIVELHGISIVDKKEYWVATSQQLPNEALLLTSKLRNLYSGIEVTNQIGNVEEEILLKTEKESNQETNIEAEK